MKEFLFIVACIVVSIILSMCLVEVERNAKFYDCLRRGEPAETCRSVL
jgi:hypothetical protein